MNIALVGALCLLAIANAAISVVVLRSSAYEPRQKALQLGLLWLVPLVGAYVVWMFLREAEREHLTTDLLTTDLASRATGSVIGQMPDVDLHSDAADLGGLGGGHG